MLAITDVDIAQQKLLSDKASQVVENGMRDFFMLCKKVFLFYNIMGFVSKIHSFDAKTT